MKKIIAIFVCFLSLAQLNAEYFSVALPKDSETGKPEKFYNASVAVDTVDNAAVAKAIATLLKADDKELPNLLTNPSQAQKARKFLKMARLNKDAKIFAFKFGKYRVAAFEIPNGSRMRKGLNYIAFDPIGEQMLWDVSVNDAYLALIAQCDISNPQKIDVSKVKVLSASDKAKINDLAKRGEPLLIFENAALVSVDPVPTVAAQQAAIFYKKIQKLFFDWKLDEYSGYMSPKSKALFNAQYSGMSDQQKKAVLSEYFSWNKKYLKVMQLSPSEFIVIFKRQKKGEKDQIDLAYITLDSKDGSSGKLEKFGVKTPLDIMLFRYFFK